MPSRSPRGHHPRPAGAAPIRRGSARIALGAQAAGVDGITIVPVGILYESKFKVRSRALVRVGEPIDVDDAVSWLVPGRRRGVRTTARRSARSPIAWPHT